MTSSGIENGSAYSKKEFLGSSKGQFNAILIEHHSNYKNVTCHRTLYVAKQMHLKALDSIGKYSKYIVSIKSLPGNK